MPSKKMTTLEIEVLVARHFSWRQNIIVPNVSWGMFLSHECDLFIISESRYVTEIEIKISKSDLRADAKKPMNHSSPMIRRLFFAIPWYLKPCVDDIPKKAGVLVIEPDRNKYRVTTLRPPKINKASRSLSGSELQQALRLASMRVWTLKEKLLQTYKDFGKIKNGDNDGKITT